MNRLEGVEAKIEQARSHLRAFEEAEQSFVDTALGTFNQDSDPETGEYILGVREIRRPEPFFGILIGDCLHNLRSALDHLAFQLVQFPVRPGGAKAEEHDIAFPICSAPEFFASAKNKIRGASPDVEAVVERLQPYNSGQPHLSLLRELSDWDKHRLLHVAENYLFESGFLNPEFVESFEFRPPGPFKANTEIARYTLRAGVEPVVDVGFYMAVGITFEEGPAAGRIVKNLLAEILFTVNRISYDLAPRIAP